MTTAVGVDIGGTKIAAGVVDAGGRVTEREELPSDVHEPQALLDQIIQLVRQLSSNEIVGVGIGAAGLIAFDSGRYLYGPNTGLRDLDLASMISSQIGLTVRLDNDANCAAWAEHRFGAGRGTKHFLCVTLGTGIGGGFVFDGRPYRGAHGGAAEIGHMLVDPDGPLCGCGRRGCWEQYASGLALERMAREALRFQPDHVLHAHLSRGEITGPAITAAARGGDALAKGVIDEMARWVGWGFASLVNLLEPERIAVGGGIAREWDILQETALRAMSDRTEATDHRRLPDVVPASLGPDAGIVGAALLLLDPAYA